MNARIGNDMLAYRSGYMLASVPNVQALTLDLTWGRASLNSYGQATGIMDLTKVGSALTRALSASPERLEFLSTSIQELAHDRHAMEEAHMRQFNGCIGSSKEPTGPKALPANPGFQFGARLEDTEPLKDMLPDSLTKLVLKTYFESRNPLNCLWRHRDLRDYFQQYLEDGYTGKLTEVVLNLQADFSTTRTEDKIGRNVDVAWQELNDICERRGITLGWNSYPFR
ncbi:hypothetical protein DL95DRAFT_412565 [Leptodontidium sp. 2 PMI_412]|nr:hypothetical protein DL95DRAFT_412565 [Leptodontidium sp. 2 PMI_412]